MDRSEGKAPEISEILPPEVKGMVTMMMPLLVQNFSALICKIAYRFGNEGWKVLEEWLYELGKQSASMMQTLLNIDPHDARSIAKLVEFLDSLVGVEGKWVEFSPEKAVKYELSCPIADGLKEKGIPQFCSLLVPRMVQGILDTLDGKPTKVCFGPKFLCQGDERCEIIIEM
jgi:hypothetical protein